jgi:phosphoribosyl 1,2-cyclic phosphate phosphodiesterase
LSGPTARVTFLGTGTSHGVPMIGCECAVCRSDDPHDRRSRPSIAIQLPDATSVLVDTTPDLRAQALASNLRRVDAILFTHNHADHVFGLDDVRRYNAMQRAPIPCYANRATLASLRRTFSYIFEAPTQPGGGVPQLRLFNLAGAFSLGRETFVPVPLMHGRQEILGFRLGSFAYLTDCNRIPDASWPLLSNLATLVLDALRDRPHPTHFSVSEALEVVERLKPGRTYFTHICHDLPHAATCARLPPSVELAYDGLSFDVDLE